MSVVEMSIVEMSRVKEVKLYKRDIRMRDEIKVRRYNR